ncbi:unnamed protein product [Amoebophrya sp. A120]|nr:unnamed protein product [Amoebophrya sp. A120]|eukprot:GSA120T00012963001.1
MYFLRVDRWRTLCHYALALWHAEKFLLVAHGVSYLFPTRIESTTSGAAFTDDLLTRAEENEDDPATFSSPLPKKKGGGGRGGTAARAKTSRAASHQARAIQRYTARYQRKTTIVENLAKNGWIAERAADIEPTILAGLQHIYRNIDGKECDGLIPAVLVPDGSAPDCEVICALTEQCEAWQFYNGTCYWGNPFPERCKGDRDFYPPRPAGEVEEEADWYNSENGSASLWPKFRRDEPKFRPGDPVSAAYNRRVVGGRLRWFAWKFANSRWYETLRLYSEKQKLWDFVEQWEREQTKTIGNEKGSYGQVDSSSFLTSFDRMRLAYRVGTNEDRQSMEFCQREDNKETDYPWARHVDDGAELRKQKLSETSRYSLLRLRSAIPAHLRTGRFLNFGIGPCHVSDPLHPFFHHQLVREDAEKVDSPPLNGFGFERSFDEFDEEDFAAVGVDVASTSGAEVAPGSNYREKDKFAENSFSSSADEQAEDEEETGQAARLRKGCKYYRNTTVIFDTVTPTNFLPTLRNNAPDWFSSPEDEHEDHGELQVPKNPIEFFILDIDSHDYQILREMVTSKIPVLVYMIEIATHFPPPLKYANVYQPEQVSEASRKVETGETGKHSVNFELLSGLSFSLALDLLKDTHDFFMFPDMGDAVFTHKSLRPYLEKEYGVRLPFDEFLCFAKSHLWFMYPTDIVAQWGFLRGFDSLHDMLPWVYRNISASVEDGVNHQFMLYI